MLPSPVTLPKRRTFHRQDVASPLRHLVTLLLTRSRLTNLGVLLLASLSAVSLLFNLYAYSSSCATDQFELVGSELFATIPRDGGLRHLNHLIMVPGHAIWIGTDPERRLDEDDWILEPYQRGGNRVAAFYAHIEQGAELARNDSRSLLVFSGGQTRPKSTSTEAESYLRLAIAANLFDNTATPFQRATTENHALDSYQNLLFSVARFHEYTGRYPEKITVVGYGFKAARFVDLHRAAIRWPKNAFDYIGVDPNEDAGHDAQTGERQNGYLPYTQDLYGCHSVLLNKRRQRNVHKRFHSYYTSCPELQHLLDWCPDTTDATALQVFNGKLPWVRS
ncbi:hypothetical protein AX16_010607 [Volvariella volvacea WC 439]|nr:hypothetical protein AX16_010607 [Volvariella volvacea WC 439]